MTTDPKHEKWFEEAASVARLALCARDRCGAVLVRNQVVIGRGYNAPPKDDKGNAKCYFEYPEQTRKPKSDRTCCMHAEWRAILDTLRNKPEEIIGSTLYFVRVDENGEVLFSGEPYCTVCSRLALDTGIAEFALWHENGIEVYDTATYNNLSYRFHNPK